jgi:hypothetical protein
MDFIARNFNVKIIIELVVESEIIRMATIRMTTIVMDII